VIEKGMSSNRLTSLINDDIIKNLKYAGVERIECYFDGSGDSGTVEDAIIIPDLVSGEWMKEQIRETCSQIIHNNCGGWEINEGSSGKVVIDLTKKQIKATISITWNPLEEYDEEEEEEAKNG